MNRLRVALFVEGSEYPPVSRHSDPLRRIWNDDLMSALGVDPFDFIIPISKKHLVAMDPDKPRMSGASEGLDQLLVRKMKQCEFDAAVVAWDLVPAWNPDGRFCRWNETKSLYHALSASTVLPESWRKNARTRYEELDQRVCPSARKRVARVVKDSIVAVCMDPMFESLLIQDERAAKRALGVARQRIPDWPSEGWGNTQERHPDNAILKPAVTVIRKYRPKPSIAKQIPRGFENDKTVWGEYLLRKYLEDQVSGLRYPATGSRTSNLYPIQGNTPLECIGDEER